MSAEPRPPMVVASLDHCARWRGGDMRECVCRLTYLGGWAECPDQARGILAHRRGALAALGGVVSLGGGNAAPSLATGSPGSGSPGSGFTGDACDMCGNFRLVRTGTCTTCLDCGSTGGCG